MMKPMPTMAALLLAAALAGCAEKPQTHVERKSDDKAAAGAQNNFVSPGWKPGDEASWEQQMKNRAQGQNEYARASAQSGG